MFARRAAYLAAALCLSLAGGAFAEPLSLSVVKAETSALGDQGVVHLILTPESREAFGRFTSENVGRSVELRIDGKAVLSARLMEPILGGEVEIGGLDMDENFKTLAKRLRSGTARLEVDAVE